MIGQNAYEFFGRRRFFNVATGALARARNAKSSRQCVACRQRPVKFAQSEAGEPFQSLKQIDAGVLNVGYVEAGPVDGPAPSCCMVGLMTFIALTKSLHAWRRQGFHVIVPYARGYGATRFLSNETPRTGQPSALAVDTIALMDALNIRRATIAGFDWGARTADIVAALWPDRAIGHRFGERLPDRKPGSRQVPLPPKAELQWWYQYYFATERGREGYDKYRREFAELIWRLASPKWEFDDATFARSAAALDNPDHVDIVIHNYRWRLGLAQGDPGLDELEAKLAAAPQISVPTITLEGDENGAPHPGSGQSTLENSLANICIASYGAASVTICLRRLRKLSHGR